MASYLHEEIAALKLKVGILEDEIVVAKSKLEAAEKEVPPDRVYLVNLGQQLVASKNEIVELRKIEVELRKIEVEMRKKENILLEQQRTQDTKSPGIKLLLKIFISLFSLRPVYVIQVQSMSLNVSKH